MEYHDPLNAILVLPFQRPRDGRSTLPILPSLPQLGLLRCREPNPRRHHGTPPSPRKIRRCCADRLNPPPESGHRELASPFGVKHFQAIQHSNVDVAHGLALLFGLGTRALPSWDSKTR